MRLALLVLLLMQVPQDLTLSVEPSCSPDGWQFTVEDAEPSAEYMLVPVLADMPGGTYFQPYVDYGASPPQFTAYKVRREDGRVENLARSQAVELPVLDCSGGSAATTTTTAAIGSGSDLPASAGAEQLPFTGPRETTLSIGMVAALLVALGSFLASWFRPLRLRLRRPRPHW